MSTDESGERRALLAARKFQQQVEELQAKLNEPIAIVGLASRLPFESFDASLWEGLSRGIDATREIPSNRWDGDAFFDPDRQASKKSNTKAGSFLSDVEHFDARFFSVSPIEAAAMDPQHRILLETAWEALANAGLPNELLTKISTGVFLGMMTHDYHDVAPFEELPDAYVPYFGLGNSSAFLSGRLSYVLGLTGPSLVVDTACSSSLVALHLACESLRSGMSDVALAGGVNLMLVPRTTVEIAKVGALSSDGRCRSFDASGDGYGRGEGCGVVVLKRLRDAVSDGDRIIAVVRGSAVNHGGASDGMTAPNGLAHQRLIRAALAAARLTPADVQYVEAHGTGTPLGDPIEVEALSEVFSAGHSTASPLRIGSVKSNIGHLEGAAGIAGLLKAIVSIQHRQLPPSLHFKTPNPYIEWSQIPIRVQTELGPWPNPEKPLVAGISSFGMSGTNAHIVLSEPPKGALGSWNEADKAASEANELPLFISARSRDALQAYAKRYADYLKTPAEQSATWLDVAYSSCLRSTHLEHRLVVVGRDRSDWATKLDSFASGKAARGVAVGHASGRRSLPVFVFSGQGTQWWGMARDLLDREPVFRQELEQCASFVRKEADWSLIEELQRDEHSTRVHRTDIAQPALVSVQMALVRLLASRGVEPSAVVGHSVGEISAACAAGVLTLEQACRIATIRGRVMQKASGKGKMASVRLSAERAEALLHELSLPLVVGAHNGPEAVVVSGEPEAVVSALSVLRERGIETRELKVDYAFHSPQMEPFMAELGAALKWVDPRPARLPIVSTLTGASTGATFDAAYWVRQMREPVRFAQATQSLLQRDHDLFIEVGPHPVLLASIDELAVSAKKQPRLISTLRRNEPQADCMLEALGAIHCAGYEIDWRQVFPVRARAVALPAYPWQRERHWLPVSKRRAKAEDRGLRYEMTWRPLTRKPAVIETPGRWLVLSDDKVGPMLAAEMERLGKTTELVLSSQRASLSSRLEAGPWEGIVQLWDLPAPGRAVMENAAHDADQACCSVLSTLSSLVQSTSSARLWLVTRRAEPVTSSECSPAQASLWGLGRVIALEHPDIWGGSIDIDESGTIDAATLARVLASAANDGEDQLALRGNDILAARLVRTDGARSTDRLALRADGAYLITGGLGGIGLAFARRLASRGAKHLVLTGRTPLRPEGDPKTTDADRRRAAVVSELRARGVEVEVFAADTADRSAMANIIVGRQWRGVVHAAGVAENQPLVGPDSLKALRATFRAKVAGAQVLHELTQELELDFFVMTSSASAIWGGSGQGHYAAGNHFMDALAHVRKASGRAGTSINLGAVRESGLLQSEGAAFLASLGLHTISNDEALDEFEAMIKGAVVQATVARVDWEAFKPVFQVRRERRWFDDIRSPEVQSTDAIDTRAAEAEAKTKKASDFLVRLRSAPTAEQRARLEEFVRERMSEVMAVEPSVIEADTNLSSYGMDSLKVVALRRHLESHLQLKLPVSDLWSQGTVSKIVSYLLERLELRAPSVASPSAAALAAPGGAGRWLVTPQPVPNPAVRMFFFPYAGGGAPVFYDWAKELPPEFEVSIVALPGRNERMAEPTPKSFKEIVEALVPALEPLLDRPFAMFGHCLGAIIMYEAVKVLRERGHRPIHLFASGAPPPPLYLMPSLTKGGFEHIRAMLKVLGFAADEMLEDEEALSELMPPVLGDFDLAASYRYSPGPLLDVPLMTFAAKDDPFGPPDIVESWSKETTGTFAKIVYSGGHYFLGPERTTMARIVVDEVTHHLNLAAAPRRDALVPLRVTAGASRTLLCVPDIGGDVGDYAAWPGGLPDDVDVYVADLPGRGAHTNEAPLSSVDAIVQWLLPAVKEHLERPLVLFGHGLGATTVYELSRALRRLGLRLPERIFVSSSMAPHTYYFPALQRGPTQEFVRQIRLFFGAGCIPASTASHVLHAECRAMATYKFQHEAPLEVPLTAIWGDSDVISPEHSVRAWKDHTTVEFVFSAVSGDHGVVRGEAAPALEVVRTQL